MSETMEKPISPSPQLKPLNIRGRKRFPLASDHMQPVMDFCIGGRYLSLYAVSGRTPSCCYSLYRDVASEPNNPLQHAMSDREAFQVIHNLLEEVEDERIDRLMDFKFEQR